MRIVVVGDVMLDVDLSGEATRLSPDAPVPVVDVSGVRRRAGGAGLVARMLVQEGWPVTLVTVLGDDDAGRQLQDHLAGVRLVAGPSGYPSPVKTRVRAGSHAVVRFDQGCEKTPVPEVSPAMLQAVEEAGVIIVADYGRGVAANPRLRELLSRLAGQVPIVWDPHPSGPEPVPGVAVVTPNLSEAVKAAQAVAHKAPQGGSGDQDQAAEAGRILLEHWESQSVLVTKGEQGAVLLRNGNPVPHPVPAPRVEAGDPCGAGDRLAAGLAVHLLAGRDLEEAAALAVQDAADFLAAGGVSALPDRATGTADQESSTTSLNESRLRLAAERPSAGRRPTEPLLLARTVRKNGGTVVATGGCFDLLHAGHVGLLQAARRTGDCLVVCLNSDASVRRRKGPGRPINPLSDRIRVLRALECVDAVAVFDEDTPEELLKRLRPDVWVKGGDYALADLPEAALVESWGGQAVLLPYLDGRSSSRIAARAAVSVACRDTARSAPGDTAR